MRKISRQMQIRLTKEEYSNIERACSDLGMKPATYVRTILLRELAATFPKDEGAKNRLVEQVATMAGQVLRTLTRSEVAKRK